jgi:hypothetical protein
MPVIRNDAAMLFQYEDGDLLLQGDGFTHLFSAPS